MTSVYNHFAYDGLPMLAEAGQMLDGSLTSILVHMI